jgi:hypothetical protein
MAQTLDDAAVAAAIKAGETKQYDALVSTCVATPGFMEGFGPGIHPTSAFDVTVATAAGRIAFMAAQAKRLYKPLTVSAVTEEMRQPGLHVLAYAQAPSSSGNSYYIPSPIETLVLKHKQQPAHVLQPETMALEPAEWKNLLGGTVQGNHAVALFALDAFRALPPGDVDVVLVTAAGERRCKIGQKDRVALMKTVPTTATR